MNQPDTTAAPDALTAALALQQAGRLEEAEAAYRAILADDPDELDALNLLGLVLQDRGELIESIELLTSAIERDPDFPEALTNLARAQYAAGDVAAAADNARRATELDPELPEAFVQLCRAQIHLGDRTAVEAGRTAAALAPDSVDAQLNLGLALSLAREWPAAIQAYQTAHRLDPKRVDVLVNLAAALFEQQHFDAALRVYRSAQALVPEEPRVLTGLAFTLHRTQDPAAAAAACRRALDVGPPRADLWCLLGDTLTAMGDFEDAAASYHRCLDLDPSSPNARWGLSKIAQSNGDTGEVVRLLELAHDETRTPAARASAGFTAAALQDKGGSYDEAFANFALANRIVHADAVQRGQGFDATALKNQVDGLIATFQPATFAALRNVGNASELPVFIVGMPRSGTTLVEQIAACHPQVFGAGERKDLAGIANSLEVRGDPLAWDRDAIKREADRSISQLRALGGAADRVINKLPDNILLLGLIAVLFPQARIILCRRDLRDVCLSCYCEHFGDRMFWTYDLADLAARAQQVERIARHWLDNLPLRMLEIEYEKLVADLEGESRRLIAFLGLEWDPACLAFHKSQRVVLTASNWQVRQPIYTGSIGRWRRYEAHLGPLLEGLAGLVPGGAGQAQSVT
jgi:tetratricopeptide (TPR) repeat protein